MRERKKEERKEENGNKTTKRTRTTKKEKEKESQTSIERMSSETRSMCKKTLKIKIKLNKRIGVGGEPSREEKRLE